MADEEPITIETADGQTLEARFAPGRPGALICHPHPQFGGDMESDIVLAARDVYLAAGFATLRFNLRGVGRSTGRFDRGVGETLDVAAARHWLEERVGAPAHLCGYSFGAWVALRQAQDDPPASIVLIAPPMRFAPFDDLSPPPGPTLFIVGSEDQHCRLETVRGWLGARRAEERVRVAGLDGVDHFFTRGLDPLRRELAAFVRS